MRTVVDEEDGPVTRAAHRLVREAVDSGAESSTLVYELERIIIQLRAASRRTELAGRDRTTGIYG
jgi:hypothetical protein